jgi:hypothetical protein
MNGERRSAIFWYSPFNKCTFSRSRLGFSLGTQASEPIRANQTGQVVTPSDLRPAVEEFTELSTALLAESDRRPTGATAWGPPLIVLVHRHVEIAVAVLSVSR